MNEEKEALILGSRDFKENKIPYKNKIGNLVTSGIFKMMYGVKLEDTQTGLRGIPANFIPVFTEISGDKYEYEMNILINCVYKQYKILEVPITTVYCKDIKTNFRPIMDSLLIYKQIFKFDKIRKK